MKILVTSGATREPIDQVRYITNLSSGQTGKIIAETLFSHGADVHYLHGLSAETPESGISQEPFSSFQDLDNRLRTRLGRDRFEAIIHAAAVSDFSVADPQLGKITSDKELILKLKPNFKIVSRLREYSSYREIRIVAFKLTATEDQNLQRSFVRDLFTGSRIDLAVHNDLLQIEKGSHRFTVFDPVGPVGVFDSRRDLAEALYSRLKKEISI